MQRGFDLRRWTWVCFVAVMLIAITPEPILAQGVETGEGTYEVDNSPQSPSDKRVRSRTQFPLADRASNTSCRTSLLRSSDLTDDRLARVRHRPRDRSSLPTEEVLSRSCRLYKTKTLFGYWAEESSVPSTKSR